MNWNELPEFKGIDLQDSWVMSWRYSDSRLSFVLEASIWPGSEHYETPKVNAHTCYKPAKLIFEEVSGIKGLLKMSEVRPSLDPNGEKDFGNIEDLETKTNGFRISGEFGTVELVGGKMRFEVGT